MAIGYGGSAEKIAGHVIGAALKLENYPTPRDMFSVALEAVRVTRNDKASDYDNMLAALRYLGWR